jgi:hypothetical protein
LFILIAPLWDTKCFASELAAVPDKAASIARAHETQECNDAGRGPL